MKLKILLADDEELARLHLRNMLKHILDVEICGEAKNGKEAVSLVKTRKPDLLLLDIHMPGMDGFQVIEKLKNPPLIIFVTAYDQYAVKAFDVESIDYLLKPIGKERLMKAIDRARERIFDGKQPVLQIKNLLDKIRQVECQFRTRFSSLKKGRIIILNAPEITHFQLKDTILFAHTAGSRYTLKGTLDSLENELDPAKFFRCHRSVIVNLDFIREITPLFKDNYLIILNDPHSTELPLSRRKVKLLKELFPW